MTPLVVVATTVGAGILLPVDVSGIGELLDEEELPEPHAVNVNVISPAKNTVLTEILLVCILVPYICLDPHSNKVTTIWFLYCDPGLRFQSCDR